MVLFVVVLVVLVVVGGAFTLHAQRRRAARARHRLDLLVEATARVDDAVSALRGPTVTRAFEAVTEQSPAGEPAPFVEAGLRGRTALIEALAAGIVGARTRGERLAAAVVRSEQLDVGTLADDARAVADVPVFAVGPRAVALVLPGLGRADALGVLARIEARCPSSGRAVELESGEDTVELAARLLGGRAPQSARPQHHT